MVSIILWCDSLKMTLFTECVWVALGVCGGPHTDIVTVITMNILTQLETFSSSASIHYTDLWWCLFCHLMKNAKEV